MKKIQVNTSRPYPITVGSGILGQISIPQGTETVCVISDDQVWPLYGETVCQGLSAAGVRVCNYLFQAGENSKNIHIYNEILNFLADNSLTRSDCILALGGGVVGDLAGFAAATYLRGIPYIQLPTTLLAMVDSSVGGKTGIDLSAGKNLCGAFWQPWAVFCDTDCLGSLPKEVFRDGCAEVIKYAILYDPDLFAHLEETGFDFDREAVISRCIQYKCDAVEQDERDNGARRLLNLGHTLGHAVEKCSSYTVSHGNAVAIGIAMACRASHCANAPRILALLQKFGLPISTDYSPEMLYQAALSDKKRRGGSIDLIIPRNIGNCVIVPTPVENLKSFIEEGL